MTDIASHRGGALLWPENSRTAFENTAKLSVDEVEFDIHPTRDGKLVVIHDATLDRTTDGTGPVCEKSFAELSRLTLKGSSGDHILLIDEVIEIFRPTPIKLRVEIKAGPGRKPYPGSARQIALVLGERKMLERAILTSFQLDTVREAVAHGRPWRHVWLATPDLQTDLGIASLCGIAKLHGVPMLGIRWDRLDASIVREVRAAGLGLGGWAANDQTAIGRMLALGVDVFTTDRPDLALKARDAIGKR
ncbi:MAG: glycerophosphodiester phosphodiesterase family protein [Hyphomicrobiales bacterium]